MIHDFPDVTAADRINFSKVVVTCSGSKGFSDGQNVLFRKMSVPVFNALHVSAMFYTVLLILGFGVPTKIIQSIVRVDPIQMSAFHSFRAWSDKYYQYKAMYTNLGMTFPITQTYSKIIVIWFISKSLELPPRCAVSAPSTGFATPDRAIIPDSISWEPRYFFVDSHVINVAFHLTGDK